MSIFEKIKAAIFGHKPGAAAAAPANSAATTPRAPAPASATPSSAPVVPSPVPVDIETVMKGYEAKTTQKLNWRTSIVDLLKLLDIDSGLENRRELARELGYTGSTSDTAAMNIWLHKQVLRKLKESGGAVPQSLLD